MINWGAVFNLGFGPINIFISLVFISLTIFLIKKNLYRLDLALEAKLKSSLTRMFEGSDRQPLYTIFYNLHHSSTEAWVNWIKSQNEKKQTRAFRRLCDYLTEAPKELGSITKEVVKAMALFEHEDSYEVLANLLKNSREDWGKFKALNLFYEDAAKYLVQLNPNSAEEFLLKELSLAKNFKEVDELKIAIVNALSTLPNVDKIIEVYKQILFDSSQSNKVRLEIIKRAEGLGEKIYYDVLKTTLEQALNSKNIKDKELFTYCINELINSARIDNGDGTIDEKWDLLIQASVNELYENTALTLITEKIMDKDFLINSRAIFKLLQNSVTEEFKELCKALEKRYQISEEEKELLDNSKNFQEINFSESSPKEIINIENLKKQDFKIPNELTEGFKTIEEILTPKTNIPNTIRLITGEAKEEKLFFSKAAAKKLNKTFIEVCIEKLLLSPDKLEELENIVSNNKPCILYLNDIQKLLHNQGNETKRAEKVLNIIKKFFIDSRITIIGTLDIDPITLRDEHQEVFERIKEVPNSYFCLKVNLSSISAKQKQRIFSSMELKLKDEREICIDSIEEILNITEGYSNIKYLNFLFKYIRTSLLSHGKLISINSYQSLLNENKQEITL